MNNKKTNRPLTIYTRAGGIIAILFISLPFIAQAGSFGRLFAFLDRPARAQQEERVRVQQERQERLIEIDERREQAEQTQPDTKTTPAEDVSEDTTNTSVDANANNTNESILNAPVDAPAPRAQGLEQLRARAIELLQKLIAQITDTKTRIEMQENTTPSADITAEAVENLQSDIEYFTQEQEALNVAEDPAAIRATIAAVREHLRERKTRMASVRARTQGMAKERMTGAVETGERIVEKLRRVENKLNTQGADTAALSALIDEHETTVLAMQKIDISSDRSALQAQMTTLRAQMTTIVSTIQSLLQSLQTD